VVENAARPPAGVRLCALTDIPADTAKTFAFREGTDLFFAFVLRDGETIRGFVDSCPHSGWRLAAFEGQYLTRDGRHLLCTGHGALFKKDGECISGPCFGDRLEDWPVAAAGEDLVTA